jgi:hypothetical protein
MTILPENMANCDIIDDGIDGTVYCNGKIRVKDKIVHAKF